MKLSKNYPLEYVCNALICVGFSLYFSLPLSMENALTKVVRIENSVLFSVFSIK